MARQQEESYAVYPNHGRLFLRKMQDPFARPRLLHDDYRSDLTSLVFERRLFYCYLSLNGDILIRTLEEGAPLFSVKKEEDRTLLHPQLTFFFQDLCLIYNDLSAKRAPRFCVLLPLAPDPVPVCLLRQDGGGISTARELLLHKKIQETDRLLRQEQDENRRLQHALDSAASQYAVLMDTAQQYRAEAGKWYEKYRRS